MRFVHKYTIGKLTQSQKSCRSLDFYGTEDLNFTILNIQYTHCTFALLFWARNFFAIWIIFITIIHFLFNFFTLIAHSQNLLVFRYHTNPCYESGFALILGSRIHIKVKSRIRIRIEGKIQELCKLKMKPRRAVDFHNGGVETQNGAVEGLTTNGGRIFESQDTDPHQSEKSDLDPHQVKRWIRILSLPYLSAIFPRTEN